MKLVLSAKAERELESVADDVVAGRLQRALERLAGMLGWRAVPDLKRQKRDELATARLTIERLERMLREAQAQAARPVSTAAMTIDTRVRMQPKPQKRVVDRDVVGEFRAAHDRCAVLGCPNGDADPHHIWPRGRGGPDETFNLMPLCPGPLGHHEEIERIDAEAFAARYASRLPHVYLLRIKHALAAEAEKKLGEREAIDLDADVEGLQ